jgi:nucleoside-diphosphate-sugar epimerase
MRILITGASGFLGRHLGDHLAAQGHEIVAVARNPARGRRQRPGWIWLPGDFQNDTTVAAWLPRLAGVDWAINAVGIARQTRRQRFAVLHTEAPRALFAACQQQGVAVLQISALGADDPGETVEFLCSKRAADQALLAAAPHGARGHVVYPSLVIGVGGQSTQWLGWLACSPLWLLPEGGSQRLRPLLIEHFVQAVGHLMAQPVEGVQQHQLSGIEVLSLRQLLQLWRRRLGWGPARVICLPSGWARGLLRVVQVFPQAPAVELLALLGRERLPPPSACVGPQQPLSARWTAEPCTPAQVWAVLMPLYVQGLYGLLAALWLGTGLVSLGTGHAQGMALLRASSLPVAAIEPAIALGAALDLGLGFWLLLGWRRDWVLALQAALMLGYLLVASLLLPQLWTDPLGALGKTVVLVGLHAGLWHYERLMRR